MAIGPGDAVTTSTSLSSRIVLPSAREEIALTRMTGAREPSPLRLGVAIRLALGCSRFGDDRMRFAILG